MKCIPSLKLIQECGFPSMIEAVHLLEDGNIVGLTALSSAAIHWEHVIPPGYGRGKTTQFKSNG